MLLSALKGRKEVAPVALPCHQICSCSCMRLVGSVEGLVSKEELLLYCKPSKNLHQLENQQLRAEEGQ